MGILTNTNREHLISIAENYIDSIWEDRGTSNIEDVISAFANAGFTKSEFFQILDEYYLKDYTWAEETAPAPNIEDVSVGDTNQTILETALAQIGIPYTYGEDIAGNKRIFLEGIEEGKTTGNVVAEIDFTEEGEFNGLS